MENTYAPIYGPPVMYRFVIRELLDRKLSPGRIYMTQITSFVRLEVGEGIEVEEEDFAAEVAAQMS